MQLHMYLVLKEDAFLCLGFTVQANPALELNALRPLFQGQARKYSFSEDDDLPSVPSTQDVDNLFHLLTEQIQVYI